MPDRKPPNPSDPFRTPGTNNATMWILIIGYAAIIAAAASHGF